MARWASLIDKRRSKHPAILLDAGGFCNPAQGKDTSFNVDYFFEGMRLLGYSAAGVGANEIKFGRDRLMERVDQAGFELLSANIYDKRAGQMLGSEYTVIRAGGRKTLTGTQGGIRIGIFSVTLPFLIHEIDPEIPKYYDVYDPRIAALEAVSALREKGCDLIIALSYQGWSSSLDLAESVAGIDIIINGKREHSRATGVEAGSTTIVDTGIRRVSLTEVLIEWKDGTPNISVLESGTEAKKMTGRADLLELEKNYELELRNRGLKDAREGS